MMVTAQRRTLYGFRQDPFHLAMRVRGLNLNGATFRFAVRLYPNASGAPLTSVTNTDTPNSTGVRIVETGDQDGVPYTDLEIILGKGALAAFPRVAEIGRDDTYSYDFEWTLASSPDAFTSPEATILYGDFVVKGSVND